MNITGVLVDLLMEMALEVYRICVVYKNGRKILCVQVLKSLYGILLVSLIWHKKFSKYLENDYLSSIPKTLFLQIYK